MGSNIMIWYHHIILPFFFFFFFVFLFLRVFFVRFFFFFSLSTRFCVVCTRSVCYRDDDSYDDAK